MFTCQHCGALVINEEIGIACCDYSRTEEQARIDATASKQNWLEYYENDLREN